MATTETVQRAVYDMAVRDNVSAAANAATAALNKTTDAVVANEQAVTRSTRSAAQWVNSADQVTRASKALEKAQRDLEAAQKAFSTAAGTSAPAADQQARALAGLEAKVKAAQERLTALSQAYGPSATSGAAVATALTKTGDAAAQAARQVGLTAYQVAALTPQLNDIAVQLQGGQNPLTILLQQGTQITQIFGGIRPTLAAFASAIGGVGLGMGAAVVATAGLLAAFNSQQSVLSDLRAQLRLLPGDYRAAAVEVENLARQLSASTPGLTHGDARAGLVAVRQAAVSANMSFTPEGQQDLVRTGQDLARVLGTDLTEAMTKLGDAMRDPARFIDEMARREVPGFNQELRRAAEVLRTDGEYAEAFALAIGRLQPVVRGAGQDVSPLTEAMRGLRVEWERFSQAVGPFLAGAGARLLGWLADAAGATRTLSDHLERLTGLRLNPAWAFGLGGSPIIMPGTPSNPGAPTGTPGSQNIQGYLGEASRISGVDPALLAIIQRQEGVYRDGQWQTSRAGAVGPMQVMPGTYSGLASRYGLPGEVTDERSNIIAGALYLREMIDRFNGDVRAAVAAYNAGPRRVDDLRNNGTPLPVETLGYVGRFAGTGYAGPGIVGPIDRSLIAGGAGSGMPTAVLPPTVVTAQNIEDVLDRAMRLARGDAQPYAPGSGVDVRRAGLESGLRTIEQGLGRTTDRASIDLLTEGQRRFREELERTLSPQDEAMRQLRLQGVAAGIADEAQRRLTQGMAEWEETMRRAGTTPSDAQRNAFRAELVRQINAELEVSVTTAARAADSQTRLAAAWAQSDEAGRRAEDRERAILEVRRAGITEANAQAAAIGRLVTQYEQERRTSADVQTLKNLAQTRRDLELVDVRRGSVSMNANDREVLLATQASRLEMQGRGADPNSPAGQNLLQKVAELASARQATTQLENSWNELAAGAERSFDRIGTAITEGLAQGRITMASLANLGRAVVSELIQQFMRLAIIDPILNSVFGGTRGTMGGIFSAIGGGGGVGGGAWAGGAGAISGGSFPSAFGNAFSGGSVVAFAAGGVVDRATTVPMALMGEAGPEAVMPLKRDQQGRLGVAASGGGGGLSVAIGDITVQAPEKARGAGQGDPQAATALSSVVGKMVETKIYEVLTRESRAGGMFRSD